MAYDFTDIEFGFTDLYRLSPKIYLAMGAVGGSGTCIATGIRIIDLSGDTAVYHEVFTDVIEFRICNVSSEFDNETNILTLFVDRLPAYAEDTCAEEFVNEEYKHFSVECFEPDDGEAILRTKYDGEKFVKPE